MFIRIVGICAAVLFILAATAAVIGALNPRPRPAGTEGVRMPGIALEFVDSDEALYRIVGRPDDTSPVAAAFRANLRNAIRIDYVFIAAYWILFALMACVLARRGGGWPVYVAAAAALAGTGAAIFDHVENVRMTRVLDAMAVGAIDVASAGLMKWLFSFAAVALLSATFLGRGGWVWMVGVVCIAIAALGLGGVAAIRAGTQVTWPIELAFTAMMVLLLPLVAFAFIFFTDAFPAQPG